MAQNYRVEIDASTGLLGSLSALRESLIEKGSNLVVRCGVLPEVLRELLEDSGAEEIIAEEEVEYRSVYAFFAPFYNGLLWHLTGGITCLHSIILKNPHRLARQSVVALAPALPCLYWSGVCS